MATDLLKGAGLTWQVVSFTLPWEDENQNALLRTELARTRVLLGDERSRTMRLSDKIRDLERRLSQLEGAKAQPEPERGHKRPSKRKRRRMREEGQDGGPPASAKTTEEGDELLRENMEAALALESLPERTREFFESVLAWKAWTIRQREAIERSLSWVFKTDHH